MKVRPLLLCAIVLAVILLLFLRKNPGSINADGGKAAISGSNGTSSGQGLPKKGSLPHKGPAPVGSPATGSGPGPAQLAQGLRDIEAPISFFGKVVDEKGNGLPEARITWSIVRSGSYAPETGLPGKAAGTAATDDGGIFRITNQKGLSLSIDRVSKDGYSEATPSTRVFGYGKQHPSPHSPEEGKPVTFLLVKKGSGEVVKKELALQLPWDGSPVQMDLPGDEEGTLVWTAKREGEAEQQGHFTWSLEIRASGGAVRSAEGITVTLAPEDGYGRAFRVGSEATDPQWRSRKDATLFFKTSRGHFGRAVFYALANVPQGGRMGRVTLFVNTVGGRLTE
jgi:hypothetical protein